MKAEHVLLACLIGFFATLAVSTVSMIAFYLRLKRYEHKVWLWLESPLIPKFNREEGLRPFEAVLLFLKNKLHHSLQDETSSRLGDIVVLINRILVGVLALVCAITGYIVLFVKP